MLHAPLVAISLKLLQGTLRVSWLTACFLVGGDMVHHGVMRSRVCSRVLETRFTLQVRSALRASLALVSSSSDD